MNIDVNFSGVNLYPDVWPHIRNARNLRVHPFEFYQKCGFVIVGVVPDANGLGKPDILMGSRMNAGVAHMRLSIVSISVAAERLLHVSARNTADAPGAMVRQPDFQASRRNIMLAATRTILTVKTTIWTGRTLSALAILFLAFDTIIKVLNLAPAVEATTQLGYPASMVIGIGLIELICLAISAIPRTSVLGAILLTGYLGGAIATQVRAGSSLFSVVFPVIIGALIWGGLFLRDERLRALLLQR